MDGFMNQKESLAQLLTAMTVAGSELSDLLFIPGHVPQMNCSGHLRAFRDNLAEPVLGPQFTADMAVILIAGNEALAASLRTTGSCDCSYALPGVARFRVNIYQQMGHLAVVMRKLPNAVPTLEELKLPAVFQHIAKERNGFIFVTGSAGMGKTTTVAALLNELNRTQDIHIVTLEDPVEYLHEPNRASISQRELGKDFFNYPEGLRAALRQAPGAILVGEIRDRETMEVALMAAETGHIVFATLHTIDAGQSIHRILGMFEKGQEQLVRQRLAGTLRWVVSQRLVEKEGGGLQLVTEVMGSNLRSREALLLGESDTRNLHGIIETGGTLQGWHSFEQSLLQAYLAGSITEETAVAHSTHKNHFRQTLDASRHLRQRKA
jgi:twitching motility protein PilT